MLQFAAKRPLETLYIIAPFTSTKAMARRMFGPLIAPFVYHIYDNMARLEEIHAQETVPRIVMIHGDRDATIPVRMGREIAEKYPETIQYIELQGKQHVDVLDDAELWLEEWTKNR
jgi:pimeloyl-ACP methyl ester carboxylesterase